MKKVTPCPASCKFDWIDFHQKLDSAMAHLIAESAIDTPLEDYAPSKVTILEFAEYSNAKKKFQEKK